VGRSGPTGLVAAFVRHAVLDASSVSIRSSMSSTAIRDRLGPGARASGACARGLRSRGGCPPTGTGAGARASGRTARRRSGGVVATSPRLASLPPASIRPDHGGAASAGRLRRPANPPPSRYEGAPSESLPRTWRRVLCANAGSST
jgi:hypothetical protein